MSVMSDSSESDVRLLESEVDRLRENSLLEPFCVSMAAGGFFLSFRGLRCPAWTAVSSRLPADVDGARLSHAKLLGLLRAHASQVGESHSLRSGCALLAGRP